MSRDKSVTFKTSSKYTGVVESGFNLASHFSVDQINNSLIQISRIGKSEVAA